MAATRKTFIRLEKLHQLFLTAKQPLSTKKIMQYLNEEGLELKPSQAYEYVKLLSARIAEFNSEVVEEEVFEIIKQGNTKCYRYPKGHQYKFHDKEGVLSLQQRRDVEELIEKMRTMAQVGPLGDFLDDMATRLESEKSFSENKVLLLADSNDAYKGLAKLTPLFKALSEHRCLELVYKGFEDLESKVVKVHPLLLKQFNQRWFLFTYHADAPGKVEIYPVDRIQQHRALDETFRYPSDFDSSDYFEYLIGVTLLENTVLEQIHIKVKLPRAHYIETKPLCLHQKVVQKSESYIEFLLKLYPNKEMFAKFLEFGPDLEVVSPASIRDEMRNLANRMSELYK